MWRELDVGGVYLPPLLAYLGAALVIYLPLRVLLTRAGVWGWTASQPATEVGLYVCVLGLLSVLL